MVTRGVVIAGAGLAGLRAAEALRGGGFTDPIRMVGAEQHPPYDRTPLSKAVLAGKRAARETVMRSEDALAALDVEVLSGRPATGLDPVAGRLAVGDGVLMYDELIIATGSRARLPSEFADIAGIYALRTIEDAEGVYAAFAQRPKVVVIGAGFIGAEVASSARDAGLDVTVVEVQDQPLMRAVGADVAPAFAAMHEKAGTELRCGVSVESVTSESGHVTGVALSDGTQVACELLIVGLGVLPNIEWLDGSGLEIDGGVHCDSHLCAGPPNVHVAGDVARFVDHRTGVAASGQQWMNAVEQGRYIAKKLLGGQPDEPFTGSGYFWTEIYGSRIQFAGSMQGDSVSLAVGDLHDDAFLALYRRGDRLVGAISKNLAPDLMKAKMLMEQGNDDWNAVVDAFGNLAAIEPYAATR